MAVNQTVAKKSDAAVLNDLQGLGTDTPIANYSSLLGSVVTWESAPSAYDSNAVLAYFQQGCDLSIS